jgi:membrane fusion protein (multidrug efflux system)
MRSLTAIILLLALGGAVYLGMHMMSGDSDGAAQQLAAPPAPVAVTIAREVSWTPSIGATGSLRAYQGVSVTAQEAGMVTAIHFDSGQAVTKGELLLQQYDLDERFTLESLKAELNLAHKSYERNQSLVQSKVGSKSQLDIALSDMERLTAEVKSLEASIAKRAIRAPFDGILGIRRVNVGQYIEPGDDIVSLQALDPIYVDFPLPQNRLGRVALGQAVRISTDAWPGVEFDGTVTALEPLVDPATRSFRVEASLPNPDLALRPGMFVDTRLLLPAGQNVLTLPQVAISYNPYGDSVFVVEDAVDENGDAVLVAKSVFVTLGETRGDQVAILNGLEAGQRVVSAGQLRLRNGSRVVLDDRFEVANNPDPSVDNN